MHQVYAPIWPLAYALTPLALLWEYACFNVAIVHWWGPAPQMTDELLHRMRGWLGIVCLMRWAVELTGLSMVRPERTPDTAPVLLCVLQLGLLASYFWWTPPSRYYPSLRRLRFDEVTAAIEYSIPYDGVAQHTGTPLVPYECPSLGAGKSGGPSALAASHAKQAALGFELYSTADRVSQRMG